MKIVDLSHVVSPTMPVYPGTEPPSFSAVCSIDLHGFAERKIVLTSHLGTHIDAPSHIIKGAKDLDRFPVDRYFGKACVIKTIPNADGVIPVDCLARYEGLVRASDFVLLHTGWSRYWGTDQYFTGFPILSEEAASWLGVFPLKGVGVDAISLDATDSDDLPIHTVLLKRDILIIENLAGLDSLETASCMFACFPMKFEHADGSPVRAVAICD